MKLKYVCLGVIFLAFFFFSTFAAEWLDEFDGPELHEEWITITWRPENQGSATIEDGQLLMNEPGDFGHMITDGRPLVLRAAPRGDFSMSMLIDTDPPAPAANYWIGLFVIGKDGDSTVLAENWAAAAIGGAVIAIGSTRTGRDLRGGITLLPSRERPRQLIPVNLERHS